MRMLSDFPGVTKVLVGHEEPTRLVQLSAWIAEWGYQPLPIPSPPQLLSRFEPKEPWLAVLSAQCWKIFGPRLYSSSEPVPAAAAGFSCVLLQAGAECPANAPDDVLEEPFRPQDLRARLSLAQRLMVLQHSRSLLSAQLAEARSHLRQLEGSLPICMDCKKIRDERNRWQPVERYIAARTRAAFTHGLCPACYRKRVEELCPAGE